MSLLRTGLPDIQSGGGAGAGENGVQHGRGNPSGEGVLLTWVITADEQHFGRCLRIPQPDLGAVTECRTRPR